MAVSHFGVASSDGVIQCVAHPSCDAACQVHSYDAILLQKRYQLLDTGTTAMLKSTKMQLMASQVTTDNSLRLLWVPEQDRLTVIPMPTNTHGSVA